MFGSKRTLLVVTCLLAVGLALAAKEARPLPAEVTHVIYNDLSGTSNLRITAGKKPGVEVEGPADLLGEILTDAQGERLTITAARNTSSKNSKAPVIVRVTLADLNQVDIRGPGETNITGFDLDALSINAAGGGRTLFDGQAQTLELRMAGAGDAVLKAPASFTADSLEADIVGTGSLHADAFKARRVNVLFAGTSDAHVFATEAITARGAGTGDLTVAGNPKERSVFLVGTGKVSYQNQKRSLMRRA